MSTHEDHRPLDRRTAELLLGGDPSALRHHRVGGLLAAASAPAGGRELAGEDAATAAFVAADPTVSPRPRRIDMLKSTLAKLLTVKVAATVVALGGAGGVALAANAGTLPGPLHKAAPHVSADASHEPRPHPSGSAWVRPSLPPPPGDLLKLCQKYEGHRAEDRRHALDEPEFGNLVKQAGGRKDRNRVDHFCAGLHKPHSSGKPSAHPSGRPSGNPGPRPGDLPSVQPNPSRSTR